jgi:phosphopantothenoylcysteine decarboxylase/phosphopantothenate--cysteine ligase
LIGNAQRKLQSKGCDWIVANLVAQEETVFGSSYNTIVLVTGARAESWPRISKLELGKRLAAAIADHLSPEPRAARQTVAGARQ